MRPRFVTHSARMRKAPNLVVGISWRKPFMDLPGLRNGISSDEMPHLVHPAHAPRLAEQTPVHSREIARTLAEFRGKERHALDKSRVVKPAGVQVTKRRSFHEREEFLLGRAIVAHDVNVAPVPVEPRLVE